jgi:hypothetical protein
MLMHAEFQDSYPPWWNFDAVILLAMVDVK